MLALHLSTRRTAAGDDPRCALDVIQKRLDLELGALVRVAACGIQQPGNLGATVPSVDTATALGYEIVLTAFLMFVIMAVAYFAVRQWLPDAERWLLFNYLVLLGWAYPGLQRFGPWRKVADTQRELDELMYAEIAERRAASDLARLASQIESA